MPSSKYINLNGSIADASQPVLTHRNRAFRYGDALFETIRLMNGEILYFDRHLERLKRSMNVLGMEWHPDFSFQNLYLLIRHLDQVNELKGNGRIRLEVFREDGGLYTPESNKVSYLIEAERMDKKEYYFNETGLKVEVYSELAKPLNKLSNLKSSNSLIYILAGLYKNNNRCDDCLILNSDGNIAEAISNNIFLVSKEQLFTPSLNQGCVAGVMREVIIDLMNSKKKKVTENKITLEQLLAADEVFLSNVIDGIRWVGAIKNKRYFNKFSKLLFEDIRRKE